MPRLFVAIDLPERIRDDISSIYEAIPGAKWTQDPQLHLTLRFIGEVSEDTAARVENALSTIELPSFPMELKGVGFFPPRKIPRVLWCGIAQNENLLRLQAKVERTLTGSGIEPQGRKYSPHITVAKLNRCPPDKLAQFMSTNALFHTEPFLVSEFHLYSSQLRREGALHTKEATYKLSPVQQ
ncbi:MAG: RNA 2',3'-cyclic phosphodiesterase [Chitinispirillaceae bacterium]